MLMMIQERSSDPDVHVDSLQHTIPFVVVFVFVVVVVFVLVVVVLLLLLLLLMIQEQSSDPGIYFDFASALKAHHD